MNRVASTSRMLWLLPLVLTACSHTIPSDSPQPRPPAQLCKTPPVLEPVHASAKQAQVPESVLPISVTADLSPLQRIIQSSLPARVTEEGHPLSHDYRWLFVRDGEPQVKIRDGLVTYQAVYRGEIKPRAARACRLDPIYPVLEGTGRLALREAEDALVVTLADHQTNFSLKPESDSKCNMFNLPLKDQLTELFNQQALVQQVSRAVDQAGYQLPVRLVWDQLQQPVRIGGPNQALCFYGKPRDLTVGSMKGPAQQTLITGLARQAPVALYQTPCQQPKSAQPVKLHQDGQASPAQAGPYTVLLTVPVPYAVLNQQLSERLFHQRLAVPGPLGDDELLIERAIASDVNGRTLLTVETSGKVNGNLYYWGTPTLDQRGTEITIPDLRMANETKQALDELKTEYWGRVDRQLHDRLQEAVRFDLSQRIGSLKQAMSSQHKSGGLALDMLVSRQRAAQVVSQPEALIADILLEGTASAAAALPLRQQAQQETPDRQAADRQAKESTLPRSARMPDETDDRSSSGMMPPGH